MIKKDFEILRFLKFFNNGKIQQGKKFCKKNNSTY